MNTLIAARRDLQAFRDAFYQCLDRRADGLFDLTDAALAAGPRPSFAHLSLAAPHRRGWGSLYAALQDGRLDMDDLRALLAASAPTAEQPVYAIDVSVWPRNEAETSAERGYYYHPSRHLDGQPIGKGWAYHW